MYKLKVIVKPGQSVEKTADTPEELKRLVFLYFPGDSNQKLAKYKELLRAKDNPGTVVGGENTNETNKGFEIN